MSEKLPPQQAADPAQMATLYADIARKSGQVVSQYLERSKTGGLPGMNDELGICLLYTSDAADE